jgi:uncharacterized cupredoxin-like copper-binding protein
MKRITLLILIVIPIVLIAACAGSTPVATDALPTNAPATQPAATDVLLTEPAATEAVPTQPNAGETAPVGGSTQVDITLADNTIDSPVTTFQVGVPYTFVITNAGRHAHNFNISTPVSVVGSLDAALQSALLAVPQSQLGAGASITVEYTFPADAAGQNLEFSCLIRRHYEDGMLLPITVTQ